MSAAVTYFRHCHLSQICIVAGGQYFDILFPFIRHFPGVLRPLFIHSSPSESTLTYLCCTILCLFSPSFCLLYYFPLCIFSLSSPSRLSCLLTLIHLSPCCLQRSTCVSAMMHHIMFFLHRPNSLWPFPCLVLLNSSFAAGCVESNIAIRVYCPNSAHVRQRREMRTKYPECNNIHVQYINIGHKQIHNKILLTSIIGKSSD